jgi:hypothetical protein
MEEKLNDKSSEETNVFDQWRTEGGGGGKPKFRSF